MDDSDHRNKRAQVEQDLQDFQARLFAFVMKWTGNKWDAEDIVSEATCRYWEYMVKRDWQPNIDNSEAFLMTTVVNLRNDFWEKRKKERLETLDDESDERTDKYLVDPASAGESEIQKPIYLRELFDEVAWDFIFKGFTTYELQIYEMHEVDEMTPATIAYELRKDVHRLRYQLTKISAKVRYRAKKFLEHTGRMSIFKREA